MIRIDSVRSKGACFVSALLVLSAEQMQRNETCQIEKDRHPTEPLDRAYDFHVCKHFAAKIFEHMSAVLKTLG